MPNNNLSSRGLRQVNYRSIPVVKIPTNSNAQAALVGRFNTAMATLRERARTTAIPVLSPQYQAPSARAVSGNVRSVWTNTIRPIIVPARRHA